MSHLERKTQRVARWRGGAVARWRGGAVARWRTSDQKLRWCAAALLQLEARLGCIKGCEQLLLQQSALRNKLHLAKPAAACAVAQALPEIQLEVGYFHEKSQCCFTRSV